MKACRCEEKEFGGVVQGFQEGSRGSRVSSPGGSRGGSKKNTKTFRSCMARLHGSYIQDFVQEVPVPTHHPRVGGYLSHRQFTCLGRFAYLSSLRLATLTWHRTGL